MQICYQISTIHMKKIKDGFISHDSKALQNKNILKKSLWIIKIINMSNKRVSQLVQQGSLDHI